MAQGVVEQDPHHARHGVGIAAAPARPGRRGDLEVEIALGGPQLELGRHGTAQLAQLDGLLAQRDGGVEPAEVEQLARQPGQSPQLALGPDQLAPGILLVELAVAVLLGILLATGIGRRLARLRAAAVRVAREGTDAPTPRDDGLDEVGDLARALATMQRELRRQEAARRSFVATASHELRTPLTSLQGTIELLEEDLRDSNFDQEDARRQVQFAQRELRRLARLASELLDLSRLDADVELRDEPVELGELCRAVAAEFELRAAEGEVELEVPAPPGPCWGSGDPGAVARAVRILIDNALRHAPSASTVRVVPAYHGEKATVAVDDDGPGVLPADRERIFVRFERGSAPSGESGFGLGLAIGRELARKMGGELRLADSESGASFVLELPIQLPAGSHPEQEAEPTPYMS